MKRYNYEDYDYDEYDEEEYEYEDDEEQDKDKNKKDKKNKRAKNRKSRKTKKSTKKSRGGRTKKKIVYRNNDNNTRSGFFSFLLFLIIVALLGVIAYLVYVNYYEEDDSTNSNTTSENGSTSEEMCEANATKYTLSSGLNKCSDSTEFKLNVIGADLSFDISRTSNEELPYIINTVYYNESPVSGTGITGISVSNDWDIKTDGDLVYLLITNPESNIITVIDNGQAIYNDNSNTEYKLSSDVTYTKYTELGLADIDTCENYEANGELEAEMWTKGKLVYENGTITESIDETITAADICK